MTMITCLILRIPAAATNVPPWPPTVRSRPPGADGLGGVHATSVTATSAPAATRPARVTPMHLRLISAAPPARTRPAPRQVPGAARERSTLRPAPRRARSRARARKPYQPVWFCLPEITKTRPKSLPSWLAVDDVVGGLVAGRLLAVHAHRDQ